MATSRLMKWMGVQATKRSFAHVAEEICVTEKTVKNVINDYTNELERTVRFETPQWIGIDKIRIIKKPQCHFQHREQHHRQRTV